MKGFELRYIIELPEGIHTKVLQLITEGKYSTMQDFAITALQNQLLIEEPFSSDSKGSSHLVDKDLSFQKNNRDLWKLLNINGDSIETFEYHNKINESNWIFGQINRVLPIKFGLRILILLLQESGAQVPLDWFHERATNEARKFGLLLQHRDDVNQKKRTSKQSVGFPTGPLSKSLKRYASQFLGSLQSTTGRTLGALPMLNFAVIFEKAFNQYSIGITDGGKEFGLLPNPVLDNDDQELNFSPEEAFFYIKHIKEYAPSEENAFFVMLSLISKKADTTKLLDKELENLFPNWSSSQRATNRSGVIGRAADLGLLKKIRKGTEVKYQITELGQESITLLKTKL